MSKIKGVNEHKTEYFNRVNGKVKTTRKRAKATSTKKMAKNLGYERSLVIYLITRDNIITALKEDKGSKDSLKIAYNLTTSFYKGLQPLKDRSSQEIQDFFVYFGKDLSEMSANTENLAIVIKLCRYYIVHRVKTFKEFMNLMSKLEKNSKKSKALEAIYIKLLEKEVEIQAKEIEILRGILVLKGINENENRKLVQQTLNTPKQEEL